jgi:hypothetical protein
LQQRKNSSSKRTTLEENKTLVKEDEWDKFKKSIDEDEYLEEYIRNYNETLMLCTLVNEYRKHICREEEGTFNFR